MKELRKALIDFVINIATKENATSTELEAMAEIAKTLISSEPISGC